MSQPDPSFRESLQVVGGSPTPEELAAVIAVLEAAKAEEEANAVGFERPLKSNWFRNSSMLRSQIIPGAGQWRAYSRRGLN